jgi:uncharacterized protein YbjT (DUF2867 family)
MRILLTGVTGYIGKRLLPVLVEQGHQVICCVRDAKRVNLPQYLSEKIEIIEVDFSNSSTLHNIPQNIDAAYYLIHSMSSSKAFTDMEEQCAANFRDTMEHTGIQQVTYLSGIINEQRLSTHLSSRKQVETTLKSAHYNLTVLRAGIIIGSGSASFEIMRDLVEKLPIMITPKWLNTKCQPIGIADVVKILGLVLMNQATYNKNFDIGGPDILTYKQMLLGYAKTRGIKRYIYTVPVMTPKLSSYWLYFITSTSYNLATALVDSMKIEVVCRNSDINSLLNIQPCSYIEAIERTLAVVDDNQTTSSWKDAFSSSNLSFKISDYINVPTYGCFKDVQQYKTDDVEQCKNNIWAIGGDNGWYYTNWLWQLRGFIDRLNGGVGLRRGRTNPLQINTGDAIDFWRVLYANKTEGRLLLFAEMKLPGEAWLEFKIVDHTLIQTATFRPKGLWGRAYWYMVMPLHNIIFGGMAKQIAQKGVKKQG